MFEDIQEELNLPDHDLIKHTRIRWLTIGPSADRALEQLPALEKYFLKDIPAKDHVTVKKSSYCEIVKYLKNPLLKTYLEFTSYTAELFRSNFTALMQKPEPLIHILYPQLKKIVFLLLSSLINSEHLDQSLMHLEEVNIDLLLNEKLNVIDLNEIFCGEKVKYSLEKVSENEKTSFLIEVKKFIVQSTKYIISKIKNCNLHLFECISPSKIKDPKSIKMIVEIAKLLPIDDVDHDTLVTEWRLLQIDEEIQFTEHKKGTKYERIDSIWGKIFSLHNSSGPRYPVITIIVKAILSLVHGNADVERGFSDSGNLLTENKAMMKERTLNAQLNILEGVRKYDSLAHKVPITGELLKLAKNAHRSYQMYRDEQRRIANEKKKKKKWTK